MAQIRVEKTNNFTQLSNELLQDPTLSLKAKGLMAYMLSVPEDWDYSIAGLAVKCKDGKSSIRSAMDELIEAGYVTRSLVHGEGGLFGGYEYVVHEEPQPSSEKPTTEKPTTEKPSTEKPSTEKPSSENRTEQNNNITNNNITNNPPTPLGQGGGADQDEGPKHSPEAFRIFWKNYPKKNGKKAAIKAWDKLRPSRELCRVMYDALMRAKESKQWTKDDGEYIPHFSTWLNQRKWEDEGVDLSLLSARASGSGGWADDPEVTD